MAEWALRPLTCPGTQHMNDAHSVTHTHTQTSEPLPFPESLSNICSHAAKYLALICTFLFSARSEHLERFCRRGVRWRLQGSRAPIREAQTPGECQVSRPCRTFMVPQKSFVLCEDGCIRMDASGLRFLIQTSLLFCVAETVFSHLVCHK